MSADIQQHNPLPLRARLRHWFESEPGRSLLHEELRCVGGVLPDLFGYHLVQLGQLSDIDLLVSSRIAHRVVCDIGSGAATTGNAQCRCSAEALPLAMDSVDVMLLPHVLEFSPQPHQVLRETERVLIGDGHVVITGFNPWSLWGLTRLMLGWQGRIPWCGHFMGTTRIKDWLRLLGFEVLHSRCHFFRPPLRSTRMIQRLAFMERPGELYWPVLGAFYIIVAVKRVIPVTPVAQGWRHGRRLLTPGLTEPSTRNGLN